MNPLYEFRKQAGFCTRCGGTADLPCLQCQTCLWDSRERQQAYRDRKKLAKLAKQDRKNNKSRQARKKKRSKP